MDQCDAETAFNCWSYSYVDNRCQLSGDSSVTWGKDVQLPSHPGAVYGELKCFFGEFLVWSYGIENFIEMEILFVNLKTPQKVHIAKIPI